MEDMVVIVLLARATDFRRKQPDALLLAIDEAKDRENEAINLTFEAVLNQVAISKAFRLQIYKIFQKYRIIF